jgi:hypothetical protein
MVEDTRDTFHHTFSTLLRRIEYMDQYTPQNLATVPYLDVKCWNRFLSYVEVDSNGCWIWQKNKDQYGYGYFRANMKHWRAQRFSYTSIFGEIAEGLVTDHLCRVHSCVNPFHLEAVTPAINTERGFSYAGINARATSCIRGHPLSGDNLYVYKTTGKRACKKCAALKMRRLRQEKKSKSK